MTQQVIYVDIDDTMVRSVGVKRILMPAVIAQVRRLKAEGATLYLWSSGGAEYCETTAVELGITDCFEGYVDIVISVGTDDSGWDTDVICHVHDKRFHDIFLE